MKVLMTTNKHGGPTYGLLSSGSSYDLPESLARELVASGAAQFFVDPPKRNFRPDSLAARHGAGGGIQTFRPFGAAGSNVSSAFSFVQSFTLEGPYDAVRFCYANYGASQYTVVAKTAAAPSVADNGTGLTYSNVTFDNLATAKAGDFWNGVPGSNASGTIPVAISGTGVDTVPSLNWTDWCRQTSLNCTDTGNADMAVTQLRSYIATSNYLISNLANPTGNLTHYNANSRRKVYGNLLAGDQVTSITAMTPASGMQWFPAVTVQAVLRKPLYNHAVFADSLGRGQGSYDQNAGVFGWAQQAVQELTDAKRGTHSLVNYACSGQHKSASWATAMQVIPQGGLDIATMFFWSPNDGLTANAAPWSLEEFLYQVGQFVSLCRRYGVRPVIPTQPPCAVIADAASDLIRVLKNDEIRATEAYGVAVPDFDRVLSDGGSPARYLAGLHAGDQLHPAFAGHKLMMQEYVRAVTSAYGI